MATKPKPDEDAPQKKEFVSPNSTGFKINGPDGKTIQFTKRGEHSFFQTADPIVVDHLTKLVDAYMQGPFPVQG